jgi:SnoaL-like protein
MAPFSPARIFGAVVFGISYAAALPYCVFRGVTDVTEVGAGVVERYLECLAAHDWDGLATTIADDGLTREGPFCDVVEGKQHYVAYLRKVCTNLKGHRLEVQRVSHVHSRLSYVELTEAFEIDGVAGTCPECILFEQADDGLISRVSVFFKQRP